MCVVLQLRELYYQKNQDRAASIKFGDFIEYKPVHSNKRFYVHVAFNSKELFDEHVEDADGDESKVDLFDPHSTYFLTSYVLTDLDSWQPCSAQELSGFAQELRFDANYGTGKLDSFWWTGEAQQCVMELVFKKGQYTSTFRRLHKSGEGLDDTREDALEDGSPIEGFYEILVEAQPFVDVDLKPLRAPLSEENPLAKSPTNAHKAKSPTNAHEAKPPTNAYELLLQEGRRGRGGAAGKAWQGWLDAKEGLPEMGKLSIADGSSDNLEEEDGEEPSGCCCKPDIAKGKEKKGKGIRQYTRHEHYLLDKKNAKEPEVEPEHTVDDMRVGAGSSPRISPPWKIYKSKPQNQLPRYKGYRATDREHIEATAEELQIVFGVDKESSTQVDEVASIILHSRRVDALVPAQLQRRDLHLEEQEELDYLARTNHELNPRCKPELQTGEDGQLITSDLRTFAAGRAILKQTDFSREHRVHKVYEVIDTACDALGCLVRCVCEFGKSI